MSIHPDRSLPTSRLTDSGCADKLPFSDLIIVRPTTLISKEVASRRETLWAQLNLDGKVEKAQIVLFIAILGVPTSMVFT